MATKFTNSLPTPPAVQALLDAINLQCPEGHWVARHAKGKYSYQWMIFSQVLQGRIDDLKLAGEKAIGDYRTGISVDFLNGSIETSYTQFNNPAAHRLFKANFSSKMLHELIRLNFGTPIVCGAQKMKVGKKSREYTSKLCRNGMWIKHWLSHPDYYAVGTKQERMFELYVGVISWGEKLLIKKAAQVAAAYLPLLKAILPLEGPPIDPKRQTRSDALRRNLTREVGRPDLIGCECHKIAGYEKQSPCAGVIQAAHIEPYQYGGSGESENGLWLSESCHCATEGRISGTRSAGVVLMAHIAQQRRSRYALACG